ncbi:2-amino-4-hydroxy-6-hydroxymethyldihydropteridine diphosphokinase [Nitratidesulfovibrio liaohensis]|uniref:2-amino-4-hydroxy-6- hydroxymethyldihydropteridine diphosphokinase n=1 Tax=Nitratidesulfovibrio liaohensis TaxID=2604158 RepID=UPI0014206E32|nr:2-amino-4-hydroxy-6-hydroxymethyldihydropteridine diphosphokinase [Nitratidesulfovibrio liaohensis]NHZ47994.1 2-amino-4-hydroxy-6-hydroxymethyldihydropteridine diphosphokinase [Nitratidesulfovibrio liaohensis]
MGSNLPPQNVRKDASGGDPADNIVRAVAALAALPGVVVGAVSSVYRTEPQGYRDQPWFANQVARLECDPDMTPEVLLDHLLEVERGLGRRRAYTPEGGQGDGHEEAVREGADAPTPDPAARYAPRTIDIDLLLFGTAVRDTPRLTLPHPRMRERAFVLVPLYEIAPELAFPDGQSLIHALKSLTFTLHDGCIAQ